MPFTVHERQCVLARECTRKASCKCLKHVGRAEHGLQLRRIRFQRVPDLGAVAFCERIPNESHVRQGRPIGGLW